MKPQREGAPVIRIDGSQHSGSGTILRYAVSLATLMGEPLHLYRIRAKRQKPGLRPQHLQAVRACCELSSGRLEGDSVDSQEIYYYPGKGLKGGEYQWDIGTAGSTTMLAFTLLPLALFSRAPSTFTLSGGLFQDFAPTAHHMQRVLLPVIRRMGGQIEIEVVRPGYVPEGKGILRCRVKNLDAPLDPLRMVTQGNIKSIRGIALSSHLEGERVSERMAEQCHKLMQEWSSPPRIDLCYDETAVQKGAALLLWAETDMGCFLGADQAGKRGRRSERIAHFVVESLMEDIRSGATTDRHLADQIILFAALARNKTEYLIPMVTEHVESNVWLTRTILGAKADLQGKLLRLEGIGLTPSRAG